MAEELKANQRKEWAKLMYLKENITQQEIADVLGTSQTMYARYERGANELPIRHLLKLCHYYQVSSDYFLGLSDIKTAHLRHDSKT